MDKDEKEEGLFNKGLEENNLIEDDLDFDEEDEDDAYLDYDRFDDVDE